MVPLHPGDGHRRVLLVEDDDGDAFLVRELLAEVDPGVELTVADSVDDVVHGGDLEHYDCVLLDLNLPGTTRSRGPARDPARRRRRGGVRADRAGRRAPRHCGRGGRARRTTWSRARPTARCSSGPSATPSSAAARRPARAPARGAARGGRVGAPGTRAAALAAAGRQPDPRAIVLPAGPRPARSSAATSSTPCSGRRGRCTPSSATSAGTGPTRPPSGPCCGCRGGRWSWPASTSRSCCPSSSRCWSASGTTGRCSPRPRPSRCVRPTERPRRGRVRLAGHPPPLVLGPRPTVVAPRVGLPLGISATASWAVAQVVLDRAGRCWFTPTG